MIKKLAHEFTKGFLLVRLTIRILIVLCIVIGAVAGFHAGTYSSSGFDLPRAIFTSVAMTLLVTADLSFFLIMGYRGHQERMQR
jgi:uncharacterized protein YneF (UPF0154 family)